MKVLDKVPSLEEVLFSKTKALIFDMDGTLLNTELVHAQGLLEIIKGTGHSASELLEQFCGVAEPQVFKTLLDKKILSNINFEEFVNQKNSNFEVLLEDKDLLSKLLHTELKELIIEAKNKGIKIALVTASERGTTELFLKKLKLHDLFNIVITRNDTEKTKPDPMPYTTCFKELGIEPDESIIFEDSLTGLAAAKASEANFYKVSWY